MSYFTDPDHKKWFTHYVHKGWKDAYSLAFTPSWKEKYLPPDSTHDGFNVELLDTTDGKTYQTRLYVAYEKCTALDEDYNSADAESLMGYFYGSHHCPCHRKADAKKAGAIVEDDECSGDRFYIKAITCDKLPGLILYSEVYSDLILEELLSREGKT